MIGLIELYSIFIIVLGLDYSEIKGLNALGVFTLILETINHSTNWLLYYFRVNFFKKELRKMFNTSIEFILRGLKSICK